jgi:hypothetical protein
LADATISPNLKLSRPGYGYHHVHHLSGDARLAKGTKPVGAQGKRVSHFGHQGSGDSPARPLICLNDGGIVERASGLLSQLLLQAPPLQCRERVDPVPF